MVLLTHWHGDHTGGVPDLIKLYPKLTPSIYKNSPEFDQQSISDGQIFRVEGATIRAIYSPGHSQDHMCFVLEEENAMFTGDNVLGHGTTAIEDLGLYMDTLGNMRSHACAIGYPAHGDVITDLPLKIDRELGIKQRREALCLRALMAIKSEGQHGSAVRGVTIGDLVIAMYGNNTNEGTRNAVLIPFVREILMKLAKQDRVAFRMRFGMQEWFPVGMDEDEL